MNRLRNRDGAAQRRGFGLIEHLEELKNFGEAASIRQLLMSLNAREGGGTLGVQKLNLAEDDSETRSRVDTVPFLYANHFGTRRVRLAGAK